MVVIGVPASHPTAAVAAALEAKGVEFRRVDRIPVVHWAQQRLGGYGKRTVPAVRMDRRRLAGSLDIMRELDRRWPQPPLFPSDRPAVAEIERWAERELQEIARRLAWAGLRRRPPALRDYAAGSALPLPMWMTMLGGRAVIRVEVAVQGAGDEQTQRDLEALPVALARVRGLVEDGTLGGSEPNAADLQAGSSLALLGTMADIRSACPDDPAFTLADRWFPRTPGRLPPGTFPQAWLAPLRRAASA